MRLDQIKATIVATFVGLQPDSEDGASKRNVFRWRVTLTYKGRTYAGDYSAGVAHCKRAGEHSSRAGAVRITPEIARVFKPFGPLSVADCEGYVIPTPPTVADYLGCLQLDARTGEHLLFEDFCSDLGYDPDSRKAERVWRACQETRGHMQRLFREDFDAFMAATETDE